MADFAIGEPFTFIIPGSAAGQGDKRHVGGGRMIERNPKLRPWRADAIAAIQSAMEARFGADRSQWPVMDGHLEVVAHFRWPRPKAHFGTGRNAGVLKGGLPHTRNTPPDVDKLLRALFDAMTQSGLIRDDARIVHVDSWKRYGRVPEVFVSVQMLPG